MSGKRLRDLNDPVLWPVIDAVDDRCREREIEQLLANAVMPVLGTLLERFRRREPDLRAEHLEELSSLVIMRLIGKVRRAAVDEEHAVSVLENYLATVAYNVLHDLRRRRHPERHRLKRNVRYVLTRERAFSLWETPAGPAAGLAAWRGEAPLSGADALARLSVTARMRDRDRIVDALHAIFEQIGRPIALDTLVNFVARLWDVREAVVESGEFPAAPRQDQLASLEQRQYLEKLWAEICELPGNQRAVLLLNLRDAGGSNALLLFLLLNVAGAAEIAASAGLSEEELNRLWKSLPLDDLTIANRLHLTRQQVINMRRSARMRLERRMAKWK